jgi:hypothetical protein
MPPATPAVPPGYPQAPAGYPPPTGYPQAPGYPQQPGPVPPGYPQAPGYPGPYAQPAAPKPPSPLGIELGAALRGFFSKDTVATTAATLEAKSPLWAVFGGGYALLAAVCGTLLVRSLLAQVFRALLGGMMSNDAVESMLEEFPFGQLFGMLLFIGVANYFIWATGVFVLYKLHKAEVSYLQAMNLTATTFVPSAAGIVLGGLVAVVFMPLGLVCFAVGSAASLILLYQAILRTNRLQATSFWTFMAVYAGIIIANGILAGLVTGILR